MEKPRVEAGGKEDVSLREYPASEGIRVEEDKCWAVEKCRYQRELRSSAVGKGEYCGRQ